MYLHKNINFVNLVVNEILDREKHQKELSQKIIKDFSKKHNINKLVVSRGNQGAILFDKNKNKFYYSDAYANDIKDKVGAGDAMLSLISLCFASKLSNELSLFSGSLAAAQSVETIGNKESINKNKVLKFIEHSLK